MPTDAPSKEVHKKAEGVEAAVTQSKADNPSPFLKELGSITGPAAGKVVDKLDKDGYTGRAEALEARKILDDTKGSVYRHLPFTDNQLSKKDIDDYAAKPGLSDGERAIAQKLSKDFGNISKDGVSIKPGDIDAYHQKETDHANMKNLYAKDAQGKTLLDGVKGENGGVSGDKLDKALQDPKLSPQDRASLQALQDKRPTSWGTPQGDLSAGALKDMGDQAGLKPGDIGAKKAAAPQDSDSQAAAAAIKDLTAKPGNGESLLDKVGDGKGGIDQAKVADLIAHPEKHNLTDANSKTLKYLDDQIGNKQLATPDVSGMGVMPPRENLSKEDLQKAGAAAGVDYDKSVARPDKPQESADQKTREGKLAHLFEHEGGKPSIYDNVKNPDGSVSVDKVDAALKNPNLKPKDADSLNYLKNLAPDGMLYGKNDLKKEDLAQMAKEHNLKGDVAHKAGLDTPPPTADRPADRPAPAAAEPSEAVKQSLRVHKGEGYYHVAERLLSQAHKGEAGYHMSQKELKDVVKALQEANGHKKSLSSKEPLNIDEAVRKNPALAKLFA